MLALYGLFLVAIRMIIEHRPDQKELFSTYSESSIGATSQLISETLGGQVYLPLTLVIVILAAIHTKTYKLAAIFIAIQLVISIRHPINCIFAIIVVLIIIRSKPTQEYLMNK